MSEPLRVAWISDFPIEWRESLPPELSSLPRQHPMTWQSVLLGELRQVPGLRLDVLLLRKGLPRDFVFSDGPVTFHVLRSIGGTRAPSLFWTDTLRIQRKLAALAPHVVHAWGAERGAGIVASRLGYPWLVTIQGLLSWYLQTTPMHWSYRFLAILEHVSLRRASYATTESAFGADWLRARYPRLSVRQIEHAPNWQFHSVARQPQTRPARLIFVGSFDLRKGADLLMPALDRLREELDFELLVLGFAPPELKAALQARVSETTWRRTQFRQGLSPREVAQELSTATLMVFPTRADTSPNSVKEAAVAGLPVVGSRVGGIPDYIFPGKNGLLFDSGNLDQLTEAIRAALRHPLFGAGQVNPHTLEQVRAYLSPKLMAEKFLGLYRELAAKPQSP